MKNLFKALLLTVAASTAVMQANAADLTACPEIKQIIELGQDNHFVAPGMPLQAFRGVGFASNKTIMNKDGVEFDVTSVSTTDDVQSANTNAANASPKQDGYVGPGPQTCWYRGGSNMLIAGPHPL